MKIKQLVEIVTKATADLVILGGDLNVDPVDNWDETSLADLGVVLVNTARQFCNISQWWRPTYGHPQNTYSGDNDELTLDYIFYRLRADHLNIKGGNFDVSEL